MTLQCEAIAVFVEDLLIQTYGARVTPVVPDAAWSIKGTTSLALVCVLPDPVQVRISVGIARSVQMTGDVCRQVNEFNRELLLGRIFIQGNEVKQSGAAILEDVVLGQLLSDQTAKSQEYLSAVIGAHLRKAEELFSWFKELFQGEAMDLDDVVLLLS